jgi:L,D-peptidoglycan transpeptidase YkuD (ErfK/YbiS/YcfS/YnhG family)
MTRRRQRESDFVVRSLSKAASRGVVLLGQSALPCALGFSGAKVRKREGDRATPVGRWTVRRVYFRADRVRRPRTGLPVKPLRPDDGWCDAPQDPRYNQLIRHPYQASAEVLWRTDHVYDLILVLDHNERPRLRGHGSAVFVHLARPGWTPTEGCIALREQDLRRLLAHAGAHSRFLVV